METRDLAVPPPPLRIIDLGSCPGRDLIVCSDVPASSPDHSTLVRGVIADAHLSIGFNRRWRDYFSGNRDDFSFSRFSSLGGMMYCKGTALFRLWLPARDDLCPWDALKRVLATVIEVVGAEVSAPLHVDDNYAFIDGKKFAGASCNQIGEQTTVFLQVNGAPLDIEDLQHVFTNKTLNHITDLSGYGLVPDGIYHRIVHGIARHWDLQPMAAALNRREREVLHRLSAIHATDDWLEGAVRPDLSWDPEAGTEHWQPGGTETR